LGITFPILFGEWVWTTGQSGEEEYSEFQDAVKWVCVDFWVDTDDHGQYIKIKAKGYFRDGEGLAIQPKLSRKVTSIVLDKIEGVKSRDFVT